ncbi:MAG: polysaccharide export protein [Gammaproteobacteria bacterium]|nr:polysaccharide export protein [Gammaproteobacteria bacterium]MBU1654556.1 polysaccharide export protein [Gammaproteobacteria bacterium]MBU1961948.1 polysaccharide export protein [Gammaproteobacteria bacterium]
MLVALPLVCGIFVSGCTSFLPSSGPSQGRVTNGSHESLNTAIKMVEVNDAVASRVVASKNRHLFSETLGSKVSMGNLVGAGDILQVSIWEAPPASLFGATMVDSRAGIATVGATVLPEQMVSSEGAISIPFAGMVPAAGFTLRQIETDIVRRLTGKANQPQVLVRMTSDASSTVIIVGEVSASKRMPLTPKRERLLDALAAAGGVTQPVGKMAIQVTRAGDARTLPLDTIIRDPRQNIVLQAGDIITAMNKPLSFTVLGAAGKNEEINIEAQGISLAQALARSGGLNGDRADAKGLFVFRFEDASVFEEMNDDESDQRARLARKVPVIYRFDMKDPGMFFVAQQFPVRHKDVLYVSTASSIGFQRFLNIVNSLSAVAAGGANVISVSN